jgi:hypothetical protein
LLVDQRHGAFHRDWLESADVAAERVVQEREEQQHGDDDRDDAAHEHRLDPCPFAAVGEAEEVHEDDDGDEPEGDPQRRRHDTGRAVDASLAGLLAVRGLIEPLAVCRLLLRGAEIDVLQCVEHGGSPWVDVLAERAVLHAAPLVVDDRSGVTHQLPGELGADLGR